MEYLVGWGIGVGIIVPAASLRRALEFAERVLAKQRERERLPAAPE
jgi:hypothetical protein